MITRSQTGSLRPMKRMNLSALTIYYPLPRTSKQAMCDPNWKQAMDSEMFALFFAQHMLILLGFVGFIDTCLIVLGILNNTRAVQLPKAYLKNQ
ncbi:hypothetical protein Tco_0395432, partial [Tanacetum coccineum]